VFKGLNNLPGKTAGSRSGDHEACRHMRCVACSLVEVYPLIYPNHASSKILKVSAYFATNSTQLNPRPGRAGYVVKKL